MQNIIVRSVNDPTKEYSFVDDGQPMKGGMKDVYWGADRSYVVAFYRDKPDDNQKERLRRITSHYLNQIKNKEAADYFLEDVFRWPQDIVEYNGRTGIIVPAYKGKFFFRQGHRTGDLIKGKEKNGKWFAAAKFRNEKFPLSLAKSELGNWLSYFQICINITRGVKKLHAMGLAHSDLSYNNILIDPVEKAACMIDLDGLVVPGLFPAEVIGTPEFIAPEVLASKHLPKDDAGRVLPSRLTDLHALPVLIYMLLLHRHPLKGCKVHDLDTEKDDLLSMGERALFIEHPTDHSNRPKPNRFSQWELPWSDIDRLPYTMTGPYLSEMFDRAFIQGLHNAQERPPAEAWEQALLKTVDLMQRCSNPACDQEWYVFDNSVAPRCPFCETKHEGPLPILDFYYEAEPGKWKPDNQRLMVYNNQYLFGWHANRNVIRNEKVDPRDKIPLGYFTFHEGNWVFVNQKLEDMKDLTHNCSIPPGSMVTLAQGHKLLFSSAQGGRLALVTITNINH